MPVDYLEFSTDFYTDTCWNLTQTFFWVFLDKQKQKEREQPPFSWAISLALLQLTCANKTGQKRFWPHAASFSLSSPTPQWPLQFRCLPALNNSPPMKLLCFAFGWWRKLNELRGLCVCGGELWWLPSVYGVLSHISPCVLLCPSLHASVSCTPSFPSPLFTQVHYFQLNAAVCLALPSCTNTSLYSCL